jgi:carbon monoxide dehydrogenase subunit G
MTTFSSQNISTAEVAAPRLEIWETLRDADALASITPLVRAIDVDGDLWVWHLRGISALGVSVNPTFTERMTFEEPGQIRFSHEPPDGRSERAGANGLYTLTELDERRTQVAIDITICVELPLPRLSRRAVQSVMASTMQRTGDRFAANLCARLHLDPATATSSARSR